MRFVNTTTKEIASMSYRAFATLALLFLCSCAHVPGPTGGGADMSAGKFHDWRGLIDDLEINKPFNTLDYGKIIVVKFETASTPLPPKDESKYEPTVTVLASSQNIFTSGLREALQDVKESHRFDVEQADTEKTAGSLQRTLLVRGKVNEMNPGSKALRYWVSFGAGQSRVEIEGDVVDAASGSVLVKFKHARSSGIGVWGGDYFKFLSDDTHDIGEDVGRMLLQFRGTELLASPPAQ